MATNTNVQKVTTTVDGVPHTTTQPLVTPPNLAQPIPPVTTTPTVTPPAATTSIPLSTITAAPQTPFQVVQPTPTSGAASLGGLIQANTDQFQQQLNQNQATAQTGAQSSLDKYLKDSLSAKTKSGLTDTLYSQTVDPAQTELNDINNQLLAEQVANRHAVEKLQKNNPKGVGAEQIAAAVEQANRDSLSKQADLSVIQLAKQGKYDSAKAIADRAVAAEFEQQQAHNDALKFSYEVNKDLFDKADQRAFEVAQNDRQSKLDEEKQKRMAEFDQKIKQSDPLYQAQIANIYSEIGARQASTNSNGTLNGKPQTAAQGLVQGYADRLAQSDVTINNIGSKFTGKTAIGGSLPNILQSSERQVYEQAKRNFVNAILRRESGAAIADSEFKNAASQYFPFAGDKPEVVAQKAANRQTVINSLYSQSNIAQPVLPGAVIHSDGKSYKVGDDGESLTEIK